MFATHRIVYILRWKEIIFADDKLWNMIFSLARALRAPSCRLFKLLL